jgi:F420 biosynthesis protein FbiB-like protein
MNAPKSIGTMSPRDDAHALLRGRKSIRRYQSVRPTAASITRIFESVAYAPSAHNRQPWRYMVVSGAAAKAQLALAMGRRLAADRGKDGDADGVIRQDVGRSYERITGAPVVIVVALTMAEMDRYPDQKRTQAEHTMAVQSTAMATQNLLLAANAEGLGTCWMCAPLFCPDDVKAALSLPADWEPQGLITLGYPAQPGRDKPRKPFSDFVCFDEPQDDPCPTR